VKVLKTIGVLLLVTPLGSITVAVIAAIIAWSFK